MDSGDSFPEPSEGLQDRIHFIFNNLSANNLGEKVSPTHQPVGGPDCWAYCGVMSLHSLLPAPPLSRPQAAEFKDLVQEEHYGWVARYLVIKRVSSEQNFHSLYMSFLDTLEMPPLEEVILQETHRNIKVGCTPLSCPRWVLQDV